MNDKEFVDSLLGKPFDVWTGMEHLRVLTIASRYTQTKPESLRTEIAIPTEPLPMKAMVDRFLGWRLPQDFSPDCGITFKPHPHPNAWPIGTNLLNADQARKMLEHVLIFARPEALSATGHVSVRRQLLEDARHFLMVGSNYAPDKDVCDQNKATLEMLKIKGLRSVMLEVAELIEETLTPSPPLS